jgi:RNA polymerase sigma factor (sigma-70 family)
MNTISKQATQDAELIAVLKSKTSSEREKQNAFSKLYSKHQKQVGMFFLKNMKDSDSAEDLKMITFEKVHRNIASYDESEGVFSTWMYSIAKNALIDFKRKEKFEVLSLDSLATKTSDDNDGMEFQIKGEMATPEQEMVRQENIKAVREAIDSIKNEDIKRLLKYRFIQELSFEEIAKLEGIDPNSSTLRVNVKRGKELIKEYLVEKA